MLLLLYFSCHLMVEESWLECSWWIYAFLGWCGIGSDKGGCGSCRWMRLSIIFCTPLIPYSISLLPFHMLPVPLSTRTAHIFFDFLLWDPWSVLRPRRETTVAFHETRLISESLVVFRRLGPVSFAWCGGSRISNGSPRPLWQQCLRFCHLTGAGNLYSCLEKAIGLNSMLKLHIPGGQLTMFQKLPQSSLWWLFL